jgi:hypothetical protein
MTISKFLPVLCVAALGAGCFAASAQSSAQDPDNPAQAAARIAIAKTLFSMQDTNAAMASTNAMTSSDTNVVMQPVDNTETQKEAKARAKAEKAAAKAAAKQKAADEKAAKEAAEAQAKQDAAAAKAQKEAQEKTDKENRLAAEQAAVAAAGANTNTATATTTPSATTTPAATPTPAPSPTPTAASANPAPATPVASSGSTTNNYAGKPLGMQPMTTPPLPISGSKEEQLQALLEKYKADQITPEQYHQQRAAILAEP